MASPKLGLPAKKWEPQRNHRCREQLRIAPHKSLTVAHKNTSDSRPRKCFAKGIRFGGFCRY